MLPRLLLTLAATALPAVAVWPAPLSFETGSTALWIKPGVAVSYTIRSSESRHDDLSDTSITKAAVDRALDTLFKHGLVPWRFHPRHELGKFEPSANDQKTYITELSIEQMLPSEGNSSQVLFQNSTSTTASSTLLPTKADESYTLSISEDGSAKITSHSVVGTLHGLQTFIQLFYKHSADEGMYTNLAPVKIEDAPRFKHRGINLDVSRNFYPVEDILKTIDAMSYNKMNVLHLHMSDSQSWPMEIPALPLLAEKGAYFQGLTYSPGDIDHIQRYALQRGVSAYIEFDMPGHTTIITESYPDLVAAAYAKPWYNYCAEPPCGTLQLNNPDLDGFLDKLFGDVLPRVNSYSPYFHTGGDEVNANAYTLDPTLKTSDKAVIRKYIQKLVDGNHARVRAAGLTPIVWEEMLLDWNLTLGKDVVIQAWTSDDAVKSSVAKGHPVIAGRSSYWYLDCGRGAWLNYENGAPFRNGFPFNDYCSPVKNWRLVYAYDPVGGVPKELQHLVLGGEVHLWSEQSDNYGMDAMLWPRASAAAEVLWSGRQDSTGQNRSQMVAAPRLAEMRERMNLLDIDAGPVQMAYCTQHNATECA